MQRRHACICDHGTGGGGTLSPPLGTATHRYIFPTAFSAISVHSCHLGIKRWCYVPFGCWVGGLTCQVAERYLRVVLNAAVYASLPPSFAASLIQQSTLFHSRHHIILNRSVVGLYHGCRLFSSSSFVDCIIVVVVVTVATSTTTIVGSG